MPTYYSSDCSLPNPKLVPYTNIRMRTLARNGLVLLYRNNNYSNTMKQCAYICDKNKIRWMNGDLNTSSKKQCDIDESVSLLKKQLNTTEGSVVLVGKLETLESDHIISKNATKINKRS